MPDRRDRSLFRVLAMAFHGLMWWAAWPFRALFGRRPGFERELVVRKPTLLVRVTWYLLLPVRLGGTAFRTAASALTHWWSARKGRLFVRGLPFVLVAIGCGYVAVAHQVKPDDTLRRDYELAGRDALGHKRYKEASLCFERLAQLDGEQPETLFLLAQSAEGLKDTQRVRYLIDRLSPYNKPVHAPSHLWKATQLLSRPHPTAPELREAEAQLLQTLTLEPQHVRAHALLAKMQIDRKEFAEAERHLLASVEQMPELRLTLAKVYSAQERKGDAERTATLTRDVSRAALVKDPNDHQSRLTLAEAEMFLEHFPESVAILQQGQKLSNDPIYRMALTRVYIAWSDSVTQKAGGDPGLVLQLLQAGLKVNSAEPMLFDQLMKLLKSQGESSAAARKMLVEQQAQGNAPALVYLLLGTDAGERGEYDTAIACLKRAYEIDPQMTIVANNLAWYLAHKDHPELEQALSLADTLVKRFPNAPEIRDTRGQILLKLSRWDDAVKDLEIALPKMRGNAELHRGLALAYRNLKLPELAAEHERLAEAPPE